MASMTVDAVPVRASRTVVPWAGVIALASAMAYADGFWLTVLQAAVGTPLRADEPFLTWLRDSALLLPVYLAAVLAAVAAATTPRRRHRVPEVLATALLVAGVGTATGAAALAVNTAWDYHQQSAPSQAGHVHHEVLLPDAESAARHAMLVADVRGVEYAGAAMVVSNVAIVGWLWAIGSAPLGGSVRWHDDT